MSEHFRPDAPVRFLSLVLLILALPASATAEWEFNGNPVSAVIQFQGFPQAIPDGSGGSIAVFSTANTGSTDDDIHAQRFDADGNVLWTPGGVRVCEAPGDQILGGVVSDGAGGIIVTWADPRNGAFKIDVYAQRLNSSGAPQWAVDGVAVCSVTSDQYEPQIVSDGAGGAVIAWLDFRNTVDNDIFAQRIDSTGAPMWALNGALACGENSEQRDLRICTDGADGLFLTWLDDRFGDRDVFVNRLDGNGFIYGPPNGTLASNTLANELFPKIVEDGVGGAVVLWVIPSAGAAPAAQRVDEFADLVWSQPILIADTSSPLASSPRMVYDPATGDILVSWEDARDSGTSGADIYAQRFDVTGNLKWGFDGLPVCTAANDQFDVNLLPDGEGGAFVAWVDSRFGFAQSIYTARVNAPGRQVWTTDGTLIASKPGGMFQPVLVTDGGDGLLAVWQDRTNGNRDIFAQHIEPLHGYWGFPEPIISSVADIPGDQGGFARVEWLASDHDRTESPGIAFYSIWRATNAVTKLVAEQGPDLEQMEQGFEGPAYRMAAGGDFFWEYVGQQNAYGFSGYSYATPTEADSSAAGDALHYFQVVSHTFVNGYAFPSTESSGYSVDNLAPGSPNQLIAIRLGGSDVDLSWSANGASDPDFLQYAVYRSDTPSVPVEPGSRVGVSPDSMLVDATASPTQEYYYVVLAEDVHGNLSDPSNEAMVTSATAVGDLPSLGTRLLGAYPNPFNPATMIRFELAREQRVTLEIFDVAGRRLRSLARDEAFGAGSHELRWDGRDAGGDAVASGTYLYRFQTEDVVRTQRMTLLK